MSNAPDADLTARPATGEATHLPASGHARPPDPSPVAGQAAYGTPRPGSITGPPADLLQSVSRALQVLRVVGRSFPGLSVQQIASRCGCTVATAYHLVRTLIFEGYLLRRTDGTYVIGPQLAARYQDLVASFPGSDAVTTVVRRAAADTGHTHLAGQFLGDRIAVTAVATGPRTPAAAGLMPGFDDTPHATALGKALLSTMTPARRRQYLTDHGMPALTPHTLTRPEAFEADLLAHRDSGVYTEIGQHRPGIASAAVVAVAATKLERRIVLACIVAPADLLTAAPAIRTRMHLAAQALRSSLDPPP